MKRPYSFLSLLTGSAMAAALVPSVTLADNANFVHGDLILTFQQEGGSNTVYANLGDTATLFRGSASGPGAANMINFKNINSELTAAFGAGWASDPTVYAGLAGVWGSSATNAALQNGDPHRTIYVSAARLTVGTVGQADSAGYIVNTNTGMTTGAQDMRAMNNWYDLNTSNSVEVADVGVSLIDDYNPFFAVGIQDAAYEVFGGGVQQVGSAGSFGSFGDAGNVEFALDLYRILARDNVAGQVGGPVREGTFEGTVTINSSGQVSFISQGTASSPYDSWMSDFTTITDSNDKLPGSDPDKDGLTNLEEFGFGGNPEDSSDRGFSQVFTVDSNGDSQKDISLTLEVRSGATFSLSSGDQVSGTIDEVVYRVEGSTDLVNWSSPVSEVTTLPGSGTASSGYVLKTFRLDAGNGLAGKGFLRASVVK